MKLPLILALLLSVLPATAEDAIPPAKKAVGAAIVDKAHPDLLRLEHTLSRKQAERTAGQIPREEYLRWETEFRSRLAEVTSGISHSPDNSSAEARIIAMLGDRDQARAALDQALEKDPDSSVLLLTKGQILYKQEDYAGAAKLSLLAWEKSGRTDDAALGLYHTSKDRTSGGESPKTVAPAARQDATSHTGASPKADGDVPFTNVVKNVWSNMPSPPAPIDVDPISPDASTMDIAKTVFIAAATATGGLFLFLGFGAKPLEEKYPNIRRNTGIALGVSGALAVGTVSWPATQAAVATQAPALIEAGKRLQTRFSGSFTKVAESQAGAVFPEEQIAAQRASASAVRILSTVGPKSSVSGRFFEGARYSPKVLSQMEQADFHAFPEIVKNYAGSGQVTPIAGGDGVTRMMVRIQGSYQGQPGTFEFIKGPDGIINHRFFRPQ